MSRRQFMANVPAEDRAVRQALRFLAECAVLALLILDVVLVFIAGSAR